MKATVIFQWAIQENRDGHHLEIGLMNEFNVKVIRDDWFSYWNDDLKVKRRKICQTYELISVKG